MKCPKCRYLGFDTGTRCKNCGYDFSLLNASSASHPAADLPLFTSTDSDDQPLVKLPPAPRPPLAVRRTPETTRLRAAARTTSPHRRRAGDLELLDDPARMLPLHTEPSAARAPGPVDVSGAGRRAAAAAVDGLLLLGIDVAVAYLALRMAGLQTDDWRLLPAAPLAAFLFLIKFSYFWAFTAVGGQTIGKMAMRIYVVPDDDRGSIDAHRALRRTLGSIISLFSLGLGFLPLFIAADRRALHDRLAGTRVVRPRLA